MDTTPNLNLPIPNANAVPPTKISEEFPRLADALIMLDAIIFALQGVVAGKAATDHTQAISTITGLTEALASKMSATATFSLDSLTDVQGAADALVNYVLVKKASGQWEPSTALAALGVHNHSISEVVGLTEQLVDILEAIDLLTSGKADKTTSIGVAGLATGGGNLSANRTITVPKATEAQAQARSQDDVALTPLTGDKLAALRDALTLHVRDQKASGVAGGSAISGAQVRVLNTVVNNGIPGASLASNQVTLPAGTYEIDASAPMYFTRSHQLSLRTAAGVYLLDGNVQFSGNAGVYASNVSRLRGRITLAAPTALELVHFAAVAASSNGLGVDNGSSSRPCVYAELIARKVD